MKTASVILITLINLYTVVQATDPYQLFTRYEEGLNNFQSVPDKFCHIGNVQFQESLKADKCKLRKTIVKVAPDNANGDSYRPAHVFINRCANVSDGKTSCMPSKIKKQNVYVEHTYGNMEKKCYLVQVDEHTACTFDCIIKKENCTSLQKYDKHTCDCVCKDQTEENMCRNRLDAMWNGTECKCVCNVIDFCSFGSIFSNKTCKCVSAMSTSRNSKRYHRLSRHN